MANTRQATKRARQNETRRQHNASQLSEMRTAIKNTLKEITAANKEAAAAAFKNATVLLDQVASRKMIHQNKAARIKSRLHKKLKSIA